MKVGSLFSGGGLGDYGLELAGMEIAFQVEIDDYCQKILNLRWPNVPKWRDIREVKTAELPRVDLISGGFPCQDISVAGKKRGITGEHSGLWKQMFRIVKDVRPKFVLIENVSRLRTAGLSVVLKDLSEIGYDAEWYCFRASDFHLPHERERLFLIAKPSSNDCRRVIDGQYEIHQNEIWNTTKDIKSWNQWERWFIQTLSNGYWQKDSNFHSGNDDGGASRMDRLKLLGNGQVVQVVQWIGERIMEHNQPGAVR